MGCPCLAAGARSMRAQRTVWGIKVRPYAVIGSLRGAEPVCFGCALSIVETGDGRSGRGFCGYEYAGGARRPYTRSREGPPGTIRYPLCEHTL